MTLLIQDLNKVYESKAMYERDEKLEIKDRIADLEKGCGSLRNTLKMFHY